MNDCLSVEVHDKSSQGSSFSGFGASSFPGNFKSKDFEIHDSSIGKTAPVTSRSRYALSILRLQYNQD